jgi:hypothetical protein
MWEYVLKNVLEVDKVVKIIQGIQSDAETM